MKDLAWNKTRAECRAVEQFLAALKESAPDGNWKFNEEFLSLNALDDVDNTISYICTIFLRDRYTLLESNGQPACPTPERLWTLKNALRASGHVTDTLAEIFPDEFKDFAYMDRAKTHWQLVWNVLMFIWIELGKRVAAIERALPELMGRVFAHQREEYAEMWQEQRAAIFEEARLEKEMEDLLQRERIA